MSLPSRLWFPLAVAAIGLASTRVNAQKGPALADVLRIAGDYLVKYSEQLAAIGAEEQYAQYDTSSGTVGTPTRLGADFILVGTGAGGVMGFRDVFAVGGASVRTRDDRLMTLFTTSPASSLRLAQRMADDSTRYYINPNLRALDQPTIALTFLRKENQERSTFKLDSVKTVKGAEVAILKFNERTTPGLLLSPENGLAEGRFWIDIASGAVRQTELAFMSKPANLTVAVTYAVEPKLGLWLPVEMFQKIDTYAAQSGVSNMGGGGGYGGHQGLEGRASYSKFRQVAVDMTRIK